SLRGKTAEHRARDRDEAGAGDDGFGAADVPADALAAVVGIDRVMPEVCRDPRRAGDDSPVADDAGAEAGADGEQHEMFAAGGAAEEPFAQGVDVGIVLDVDGDVFAD